MGRNNKASNYDISLFQTRIYRIWYNIKTRCTNINSPSYGWYGYRWITYDEKWEKFEWFLLDMFESYTEHIDIFWENNTSIDRKDNNWNYCKENCKWATNSEQARNRRNNTFLKFKWETKTLAEWSEITWIKRNTIWMRINNYWWSIEKALTFNVKRYGSKN